MSRIVVGRRGSLLEEEAVVPGAGGRAREDQLRDDGACRDGRAGQVPGWRSKRGPIGQSVLGVQDAALIVTDRLDGRNDHIEAAARRFADLAASSFAAVIRTWKVLDWTSRPRGSRWRYRQHSGGVVTPTAIWAFAGVTLVIWMPLTVSSGSFAPIWRLTDA